METLPRYETHAFPSAGWCPNNPHCPLLVYRQAGEGEEEKLAEWFEARFRENGWNPAWRYTIYDFAHFHSNTHEVVGAYRGHAVVQFGDNAGERVRLEAGDVVLIPAGVSHQRLEASEDFIAVGAYPVGFEPDQIRKNSVRHDYAERVALVPLPGKDPVMGAGGAVQAEWTEGE